MVNAVSFTKPTSNIIWQYFSQTLGTLPRAADVFRCYVHVFAPPFFGQNNSSAKMGHCRAETVVCLPMSWRGTMLANDPFGKTLGEQLSTERALQEGSQLNRVWSAHQKV